MTHLSVCIVTHQSDPVLLDQTVSSLENAVRQAQSESLITTGSLVVLDNSVSGVEAVRDFQTTVIDVKTVTNPSNVGFGAAHNQGLAMADSDYHLVLNPDVILHEDALVVGLKAFDENPTWGLLAPRGRDPEGQDAYLCKAGPNCLDLLIRGFAPILVKNTLHSRLSAYEMHTCVDDDVELAGENVASGCFMLARTALLKAVGGFDDRFFLYFEDYDLSRRLMDITTIMYLHQMQITHAGGQSARKGVRHILYFLRSAVRFFNKHGWRLV